MNTYLGSSFLIPWVLSLFAFGGWMVVCKRMINVTFPFYKIAITFAWAIAILARAVIDVSNIHFYDAQWKAVGLVLLKSIINGGLLVLAIVRYREIGKLHPVRMAACPNEPTPTTAEMAGVAETTRAAAAELLGAAEKATKKLDAARDIEKV